ncbi:hypothetical protein AB669_03690 [Pedobacter sp. BMA]|nr:hypothetical protein AB669_03690 [Pedobacter sp. BMA]
MSKRRYFTRPEVGSFIHFIEKAEQHFAASYGVPVDSIALIVKRTTIYVLVSGKLVCSIHPKGLIHLNIKREAERLNSDHLNP